MTLERAAEILEPEHRENYESIEVVNEACSIGREAIGYQIKKQVTIDIYDDGTYSYICPCGSEVKENQEYCDTCGQHLLLEEMGIPK